LARFYRAVSARRFPVQSNVGIYEVHNSGAWYNFGYLLGLACFFGGSGNRAASRN